MNIQFIGRNIRVVVPSHCPSNAFCFLKLIDVLQFFEPEVILVVLVEDFIPIREHYQCFSPAFPATGNVFINFTCKKPSPVRGLFLKHGTKSDVRRKMQWREAPDEVSQICQYLLAYPIEVSNHIQI